MRQTPWAQLQANFLTGLAVVLPAVISIAVLVWLFGTVSNITDTLLFAVPREWKYVNGVRGDIHWYWSLAALTLAMAMVTFLGALARHYLGKKLIQTGDIILLRVPLLNKIYSTVKQVKEAFSGNKSSFQQTARRVPKTGRTHSGSSRRTSRTRSGREHPARCGASSSPPRPIQQPDSSCSFRRRSSPASTCRCPMPSSASSAWARWRPTTSAPTRRKPR